MARLRVNRQKLSSLAVLLLPGLGVYALLARSFGPGWRTDPGRVGGLAGVSIVFVGLACLFAWERAAPRVPPSPPLSARKHLGRVVLAVVLFVALVAAGADLNAFLRWALGLLIVIAAVVTLLRPQGRAWLGVPPLLPPAAAPPR